MAVDPQETAIILASIQAFLDSPPEPRHAFCCINCHALLSVGHHLIKDLIPFSGILFLLRTMYGVVNGPAPILDVYVGKYPTWGRVDLVAIYCMECGSWLGWEIIAVHQVHPLIRPRQFVLQRGGIEIVYEDGVELGFELMYRFL